MLVNCRTYICLTLIIVWSVKKKKCVLIDKDNDDTSDR